CADCDKGVLHDCPYDAFIVIKDGVLEQGVIDKASIGAEKSESLFHRIVKDYGAEEARTFLNAVTKLLDRYMVLRGFTYAFDELEIPPATKDKIAKAIAKAEERVNEYIDSYRKATLERLPGQSLEESLELYIMNELSRARDVAGDFADQYFQMDNSGVIMSRAGRHRRKNPTKRIHATTLNQCPGTSQSRIRFDSQRFPRQHNPNPLRRRRCRHSEERSREGCQH